MPGIVEHKNKPMKHLKTILTIIFVVSAFNVNAQEFSFSNFSWNFGWNLPIGNFADDDNGGAKSGFITGFKYETPIEESGVTWYSEIDMYFNAMSDAAKTDANFDATGATIDEFPAYINIPIAAGPSFKKKFDKFTLTGNAGAVLNFLKMTDMEVENETVGFAAGSSIGGRLEAGVENDNTAIFVRYDGFGEHTLEVEHEQLDGEVTKEVSTLSLLLYYKF